MVSISAKIYSKKILTPPYEWHKNMTPRWLYRRCLSHRRVGFRSILFNGESAITVHNAVIWFMKEKMGGRKSWNTVSFGKYFFLRGQRTNLTFRNPCELVSQRGEDEPPPGGLWWSKETDSDAFNQLRRRRERFYTARLPGGSQANCPVQAQVFIRK